MIDVFIDCTPPTATAQHRKGKAIDAGFRMNKRGKMVAKHKLIFFEDGDVKAAREMLTAHFSRHAPLKPLAGPLYLEATWTFNWFAYELPQRKAGKLGQWEPSIVKPDTDNLVKMLKDVLEDLGYWKNDAHVSAEYLRRGRGDRPGVHIRIEPYEVDYTPPEDQPPVEISL